jgi:hypothetical protein
LSVFTLPSIFTLLAIVHTFCYCSPFLLLFTILSVFHHSFCMSPFFLRFSPFSLFSICLSASFSAFYSSFFTLLCGSTLVSYFFLSLFTVSFLLPLFFISFLPMYRMDCTLLLINDYYRSAHGGGGGRVRPIWPCLARSMYSVSAERPTQNTRIQAVQVDNRNYSLVRYGVNLCLGSSVHILWRSLQASAPY